MHRRSDMPKQKSHKGMLKRVRVTKSGKVKVSRSGGRHLKSHKSSGRVRGYRKPKYVKAAEAGRVGAMLNRHVRSAETEQAQDNNEEAKTEPAASPK